MGAPVSASAHLAGWRGICPGAVAVPRALTSFSTPAWITGSCGHSDSQVSAAGHGVTQGWTCSHMSDFCTHTAAVLWLPCQ